MARRTPILCHSHRLGKGGNLASRYGPVLAQQVQAVTGETVGIAFADQCYTGQDLAQAAKAQGIDLHIVKLPEVKKGFVMLTRPWVVEGSFGWLDRFRRLTRDYERLPETLAGLHFVVFAMLMLTNMLSEASS